MLISFPQFFYFRTFLIIPSIKAITHDPLCMPQPHNTNIKRNEMYLLVKRFSFDDSFEDEMPICTIKMYGASCQVFNGSCIA